MMARALLGKMSSFPLLLSSLGSYVDDQLHSLAVLRNYNFLPADFFDKRVPVYLLVDFQLADGEVTEASLLVYRFGVSEL